MTTIARSHVMRPDRVYRTGVLSPMVGYTPQADVQSVARMFTQGPPLGMTLQGLGGGPAWWERLKARIAAWRMRMRGGELPITASAPVANGDMGAPGPMVAEAAQVAPQMQAQMVLLSHLTQTRNPAQMKAALLRASNTLAQRRPFTYYYAG
jgi:hypothetical protein